MRCNRSAFVKAAATLSLAALSGCTVYSTPPRFEATAGVEVRRATRPPPAPPVERVARPAPPEEEDNFSIFYSTLYPYGQWLDTPVCGRRLGRVWRPSTGLVGQGFVPYQTGGEWVPTDQGWAFESDWDWGWVTFHYGRWCEDPRYGWVWAPGDQWAPAWVQWRQGGGYVGWAPIPPAGVVLPDQSWVFVEQPSFAGRRVTRYALPRERIIEAKRVARPLNRSVRNEDYVWYAGPRPEEVLAPDRASRPVHVAPPKRGKVRRVIVRPRPE